MASKLPMFGFRTTRENLDKLAVISDFNGRSANRELEQLLISHIRDFESVHGKIDLSNISKDLKQES